MAGRRCPGKHCPRILTNGERHCPTHAREYEGRRGTTTQRGYGTNHQQLRAAWQARIDAGETVLCADGCGTRITGTNWDLGHADGQRAYIGPQTRAHNRSNGGKRGRATQD